MTATTSVRPRRFARLRNPVVGLFVLAPLVGEYLLGDLPLVLLPAIVLLAPMYGGGALLIRETARRRGLGWPGILLLALAYGVLEEGLVTQSLFNPDYVDERLLDPAYVPWLGTGLVWALFVLGIHVMGSIGAPIAVVEATGGTAPWLGRRGIVVSAVLFVVGCVASFGLNYASQHHFVAPWYRLVGAAVVAALIAGLALSCRPVPRAAGPAPGLRTVGVVVFVLTSAFMATTLVVDALTPWGTVAAQVVLAAVTLGLLAIWCRDRRLVLVAALAVLATYAWFAYRQVDLSAEGIVVAVGNVILDVVILYVARHALRRLAAAQGR